MDTSEAAEDDGSDALSALEDRRDDPTETELRSWIADLNDREQGELVALYWIGRGDEEADAFASLVATARASRSVPTEDYLLGVPLLGTYLEAGLDKLDALAETDAAPSDEA